VLSVLRVINVAAYASVWLEASVAVITWHFDCQFFFFLFAGWVQFGAKANGGRMQTNPLVQLLQSLPVQNYM